MAVDDIARSQGISSQVLLEYSYHGMDQAIFQRR